MRVKPTILPNFHAQAEQPFKVPEKPPGIEIQILATESSLSTLKWSKVYGQGSTLSVPVR